MPTDIEVVFGALVKKLRMQHPDKLTQQGLAEASGLHVNTVRLIEQGQYEPRISTFVFIAQGLSREPSDLMENLMVCYREPLIY